jgi:hypothetical protein
MQEDSGNLVYNPLVNGATLISLDSREKESYDFSVNRPTGRFLTYLTSGKAILKQGLLSSPCVTRGALGGHYFL